MKSNPPGTPRDHFSRCAPIWAHYGPPLRPSPDDTAIMQRIVDDLAPAPNVLVLGLTPEIVGCAWPAQTRLIAADHNDTMMRAYWPPVGAAPVACGVLADWRALPIASGTLDLVAGDGCYMLLSHIDGFAALTREVRRVLRPGGRFAIRVFLRPDRAETVTDIARAYECAEIGSVHALKLRLLAALHDATGPGSRLDDVWRAWQDMPPLPSTLSGRGWTDAEFISIEIYRSLQTRYYLPTFEEFRASLGAELTEIECARGRHELAERCPTLVFASRD